MRKSKGMMEKLKGRFMIARWTPGDMVCITLEDADSGCVLAEIFADKAVFVDALFARGHCACEYDYYANCPVGMKREIKHEDVFVPRHEHHERAEVARAAIEPYEVDGWMSNGDDAVWNMHCRVDRPAPQGEKGDWRRVTFIRFVEAQT